MSQWNAPAEKLYLFVHIPKTGGTTLWHIIQNQYPAHEIWSFNHAPNYHQMIANADRMKCLVGHFPFGVHQFIKRPCTYITMLRNPVERVISYYYYYLARLTPGQGQSLRFEDFLESPYLQNQISNTQTLYLSGGKTPDLQKAVANLVSHFAVVGITEMFKESLFFIKKECNWNLTHYPIVNKGLNRPEKIPFSQSAIETVVRKNQLDLALYQFARQRLLTRILQLPLDQKAEYHQFLQQVSQH